MLTPNAPLWSLSTNANQQGMPEPLQNPCRHAGRKNPTSGVPLLSNKTPSDNPYMTRNESHPNFETSHLAANIAHQKSPVCKNRSHALNPNPLNPKPQALNLQTLFGTGLKSSQASTCRP